jgi:hypothetical protein
MLGGRGDKCVCFKYVKQITRAEHLPGSAPQMSAPVTMITHHCHVSGVREEGGRGS